LNNALTVTGDQPIYTPTSLTLPPDMTFEAWSSLMTSLLQMERSVLWWIGDALQFGEQKYGEMYTQAVETTAYSYGTLRNAKWVCGQIELSRRRDNLSWSHHYEVASLPVPEQESWLSSCQQDDISRNQLRQEVQRAKMLSALPAPTDHANVVTDIYDLVRRGEKFGTIYADPPWQYGNQATRASTDNHYTTMSNEEIAALPVKALAAENCHLHLWTTNAFLFDCPAILEAWGFTYKSMFVWVKPQIGMGNYWRVSHEYLIFAVRANAPFLDRSLKSWAEIERGEHSAKPEQVRMLIEKASPSPRLEMFGRRVSDGWTVWGNEVKRDLFHVEDSK